MSELNSNQQRDVEDLFDRMLEMDPPSREAQLDAVTDPRVAAEVRSLLAVHRVAAQRIDTPIADAEAIARVLRDGHAATVDLRAGSDRRGHGNRPDRIGSYEVLSILGEGGMGTVYLAEQTDPLRRQVAIKLIKLGMDTRAVLTRFDAERQALAMMNHPNVAKVLDAGAGEDGRPFFVMEYVPGERITKYCDTHQLDTDARLRLFTSVCEAIQHAHQKGIIHRDVKPSNVLVSGDNGNATAKVIDFGVAKAVDQKLTDISLVTEHGVMIGTPEYMSPEQADATVLDIDTRTDIYSLGVLLYELLVGALPAHGNGQGALPIGELRRLIQEIEPVKPSTRVSSMGAAAETAARNRRTDLSSLRRRLRGDLDWIVMKCLEKDRNRRYATAAELSEDILRYLRHEPILAGPPSASYRAKKFVRRHRPFVIGAAAVCGVFLAGLVSTIVFAVGESNQRDAAQRQADIALAANRFLTDMLAAVDPRNEGVDVTVREVLDQAAARAETDLVEHPTVEQSVRTTIGRSYKALGLYDHAYEHLGRARDIAVSQFGDDDPKTADALNELGLTLRVMARPQEAEALHRRALAIARAHADGDDLRVAEYMNNLARVLYDQGRYEEGRPLCVAASEMRGRLVGKSDITVVISLSALARAAYAEGNYVEAAELQEEAYRLSRAILGDEHLDTLGTMNNAAFGNMKLGQFQEAERMYRDAVAAYRRYYGDAHPDIARTLNNLAEAIRRQGRHEEAASVHREALAMRRETLGEDHPLVAVSYNNLGLALTSLEAYDEAVDVHQAALQIRRDRLGEEHPHVATSLGNLGFVFRKQGELAGAIEHLEAALAIRLAAFSADHPAVANTRVNLARCRLDTGELAEAEQLCREALVAQSSRLGDDHPETAATRQVLGRVLTQAGQYTDAEPYLLACLQALRARFDASAPQVREAIEDLAALYEAWGRPEEAAHYRGMLETDPPDGGK